MHPHDRAVDHLDLAVVGFRNNPQNVIPVTSFTPADEAIVAGRVRAVALWDIGPRRAAAQPPEYAVEDTPVINPLHAARLLRQQRRDDLPLGVSEFVACHLKLPRLGA